MTSLRRRLERVTVVSSSVNVGAFAQQQLDDGRVTFLRRCLERVTVVSFFSVDVGVFV